MTVSERAELQAIVTAYEKACAGYEKQVAELRKEIEGYQRREAIMRRSLQSLPPCDERDKQREFEQS